MSINSISQSGYSAYAASTTITKDKDSLTKESVSVSVSYSQTTVNSDSFVLSEQGAQAVDALGYTPVNKLTSEQVEALERHFYESMKSLAEKMFNAQAGKANAGGGSGPAGMSFQELADALGIGTTPETAAQAISEDGMWGVDAVATRLMDFAMQLANGDSAMAAELRDAVTAGFEAVGDIDSLPQVCQDTYAETMARFDYWEQYGSLEGYGEASSGDAE